MDKLTNEMIVALANDLGLEPALLSPDRNPKLFIEI